MHSHPRHIVNRVLGGSEMLIWDVDTVIIGIDLQVRSLVGYTLRY